MENEPLLDPYLFDRIKYIKTIKPNSKIEIITNGILLDKYKEKISENVDILLVSLDGYDAESYNYIHKTNVTSSHWNKINEAIDFIENVRYHIIDIVMLVTKKSSLITI